jgi:hypothetical protein
MLYGAKVGICSEIITVLQSVKFLNVKLVGASHNQQALRG